MTQDELNRWCETIARILAECHNRNLNTVDLIAARFAVELSNYGDGFDSVFQVLYQSRTALAAICPACGSQKPVDQSCGCFDNGSE